MKYDFNVSKMKDKVQINVDEWIQPYACSIKIQNIRGRAHITHITEATAVGSDVVKIKKGDYLLISRIACEVATAPTSPYTLDTGRFYNIPCSQVMGIFQNNILKLKNLKMLNKSILFKRISNYKNSFIQMIDSSTMLGEVLKTEENSEISVGDIILLEDNVSTLVEIESTDYYAAEERAIIGVFHDKENISIQNLKLINENVIMKPYISQNSLNSKILINPNINYEDLDYSDVYNRDLFKVEYYDKKIREIHKNSILLINRDYTRYTYFNNEKYFVINGKKWISGKIIERTK